jgi:hypothetical protein
VEQLLRVHAAFAKGLGSMGKAGLMGNSNPAVEKQVRSLLDLLLLLRPYLTLLSARRSS